MSLRGDFTSLSFGRVDHFNGISHHNDGSVNNITNGLDLTAREPTIGNTYGAPGIA